MPEERCQKCGNVIVASDKLRVVDIIAIQRKIFGRYITRYYCLPCLMDELHRDEDCLAE